MQETRQHILEILREQGQATVDDIVTALRERRGDITAVTVRHHLNHLQKDNLITAPQLRHRSTPGRPQHVYALTEKAEDYFPNNYKTLAELLLTEMRNTLPPDGVNVIMEGVAQGMAAQAQIKGESLQQRLEAAVTFLNEHGYNAHWETCDEGFILHTTNCPYHHLAETDEALCSMDMRFVSSMLGVVPRMQSRVAHGATSCAYLIPADDVERA
ncbi:MAG: helix-turn-helix transcriptional regulator [Chloroflexota bacterium]